MLIIGEDKESEDGELSIKVLIEMANRQKDILEVLSIMDLIVEKFNLILRQNSVSTTGTTIGNDSITIQNMIT